MKVSLSYENRQFSTFVVIDVFVCCGCFYRGVMFLRFLFEMRGTCLVNRAVILPCLLWEIQEVGAGSKERHEQEPIQGGLCGLIAFEIREEKRK